MPEPRNAAIEKFADAVVGRWAVTLSNAWFLDEGTIQHGETVIEWLGDSFVHMHGEMAAVPSWNFVFGYSDPQERYVALYHDPRGTARVFDMTFDGTNWNMLPEDSDMHQRWIAVVSADHSRIECHPDVLEEDGSWRKDFDLLFERLS